MHVLEDRKPRHQPRRQRRMSGLVGIDRAEPPLEKAPVDRPAELRQRVIEVDDLVEARPEKIVLPAVTPLPGPHRITSAKPTERQNHDQAPQSNCKKSSRQTLPSCKCNHSPIPGNASKIGRVRVLHGRRLRIASCDRDFLVSTAPPTASYVRGRDPQCPLHVDFGRLLCANSGIPGRLGERIKSSRTGRLALCRNQADRADSERSRPPVPE